MPSINNLVYSDKFKKWFDTTNTIITTLNGITVYNLLQGDGVSLSSSGNVFTVSHAPTVATGVTFNGNVRFNGSVSFASNPTTYSTLTVNVSPKVNGITAGNVVRIDSSGLTLAKANSAVNAEVLGVVVNNTASAHVVAVSGVLDNSFFANTIQNAVGTTLIPGQAYFLDSVVAGGITTNEPQTYGHVSKPVVLGITGNSGSILSYRGVLLQGLSYGITAELDNKLIIEFDTTDAFLNTGSPINVGDQFLFFEESAAGIIKVSYLSRFTKFAGRINGSSLVNGVILDATNSLLIRNIIKPYLTGKEFLGLVSRVISETGGVYILEITLPGGTITTQISELDPALYPQTSISNALSLNDDCVFVASTGTDKFIDFIRTNDVNNTVKLVISRGAGTGSQSGGAIAPSGVTSAIEYHNLIPNGAFTVWQRPAPISSTVSYTTSYTTDYLMQPFSLLTSDANGLKTTYTYRLIDPIADRWFAIRNLDYFTYVDGAVIRRGLTGGSSIYRRSFDSDQTVVPGSPLYYLDCVFNYSLSPVPTLRKRPRLENIQPNARLAQGQTVTFSFWGKSSVSGSTLDVIFNYYKSNYSNFTGLTAAVEGRVNVTSPDGGITLNTAWQRYSKSFSIPAAGVTFADDELGWFGIGFEFPSSSATISLAQTQLHLGNYTTTPVNIPYDKELERCREVYQTNFLQGITYIHNTHLPTSRMLGSVDLTNNYPKCSSFVVTGMRDLPFVYPTKMVLEPSQMPYFSPVQGSAYDVYITNLSKNSSSVASTDNQSLPWQSSSFASADITKARASSNFGIPFTTSNYGKDRLRITVYGNASGGLPGTGSITYYDTILFNYILDADITSSTYSSTFAFPYTTTTIHY